MLEKQLYTMVLLCLRHVLPMWCLHRHLAEVTNNHNSEGIFYAKQSSKTSLKNTHINSTKGQYQSPVPALGMREGEEKIKIITWVDSQNLTFWNCSKVPLTHCFGWKEQRRNVKSRRRTYEQLQKIPVLSTCLIVIHLMPGTQIPSSLNAAEQTISMTSSFQQQLFPVYIQQRIYSLL